MSFSIQLSSLNRLRLQPDPIGFKGDASNLYRYCGNDWANKTDPMGLEAPAQGLQGPDLTTKERYNATARGDEAERGSLMWDFEKRADTSGGNGSRDGRAKPDTPSERAFSAAAAEAIAHNPRVAQAGLAGYIDAARAPHTLYLNGQPVWDPFMKKWVQEPTGVSLDKNIQEAKGMSVPGWIRAVDNGGHWDYKQWGPFRDYGNINYGATGRAAAGVGWDKASLIGIGFAKKVANGKYTQKDWARDRLMIEIGINYYDQTH